MDGRHQLAEARSLELHRLVAERLRVDPDVLARARARVAGWLQEGSVPRPFAEGWREVLGRSPDEVAAFLLDRGEAATRLRHSSPFAGVLDARARWAAWRRAGGGFEAP